ncbi:bacteriophage antitermination protein Q (plasmid) [Rouxiella badensis]|uniref:Antitermination protein n=1 Tax=Rouxiella badensis TaxID=1646377 RepID=A0A1X0WB37_9GAMM|nr:bacteriophage antitermination protein Q [Rouxiella badensis]ORJ23925.1 hypothetical protein BS640_18650 [Rouxiella badensis]WAT03176.1 bacteriophage antitermination protein Q [Rouxiella badensis]
MQGEYVRQQLRAALFDMPSGQKNQIVIMAESATGDRHLEKPSRTVETDDAAVVIDAEKVRYRQGKKYTQNKVLISEETFRTGVWRQLVNKMTGAHLSWVKYCYAENLEFDHQMIICKEVWERFQEKAKDSSHKKMAKKTYEIVNRMVWLAAQIAVSKIRGVPLEYKAADLCRLIRISPDNWLHNYAPRWAMLLSVCEDLDNEVIGYVARQHKTESDIRRRARVLM